MNISFAPNHPKSPPKSDDQAGAKLVTSPEDVIEELPTEMRAGLFAFQATTGSRRASLLQGALCPVEKKILNLLSTDESIHGDEPKEKAK